METKTSASSACCCSGSFAEASTSHPSVCMRLSPFQAHQEQHLQTLFVYLIVYNGLSCFIYPSPLFGVVVLRVSKDLVSPARPAQSSAQTNSNPTWNNAPSLSKSLGSRRSAKAPKSLTRQKQFCCWLNVWWPCNNRSDSCKVVRSWAQNGERRDVLIVESLLDIKPISHLTNPVMHFPLCVRNVISHHMFCLSCICLEGSRRESLHISGLCRL